MTNPYAPPTSELASAYASAGGPIDPFDGRRWDLQSLLSKSWEIVKNNMGVLLGAQGVIFGVSFLANILTAVMGAAAAELQLDPMAIQGINLAVSFLSGFIGVFFNIGMVRIALAAIRGEAVSFGMIFSGGPWFVGTIGGSILVGLVVFLGTIVLLVPGFIAMCGLAIWQPMYVDNRAGVIDAMKGSWALMDGSKWDYFVALFVVGLLATVVLIATCGLGLFLMGPFVAIVNALVYENLRVRAGWTD
jgi:hypothetical protein